MYIRTLCMHVRMHTAYVYVTEFGKADHNVTLTSQEIPI